MSADILTRPFWSDDFDMDLPKVLPNALDILGDLATVQLWTSGKPDENGRLNHPNVWNGDHGMLAFFGFRSSCTPAGYVGSGGEVRCTAWEMFRDTWVHPCLVHVEHRFLIWDTNVRWKDFETIMWNLRGWGKGWEDKNDEAAKRAKQRCERVYRGAVSNLRYAVEMNAQRVERAA